jgi:PAS domain S-box-containing protein
MTLSKPSSPWPLPWAGRYPAAVACLLIAVGAAVLMSWVSGIRWLTSISREWPTMKVNTACCFLMCGVALWILRRHSLHPRQLAVGQICAAVIGLIALTTLAEHAWGFDLGVDQLIVTQVEPGLSHPGRMSALTATSFVFIAGTLLGLRAVNARVAWAARLAALLPGLFGLLTLVVYWYGVRGLDAFSGFSTTALHTAGLFVAVSTATLCVHAERGPLHFLAGPGPGRDMARRVLPFAIAAPLVFGWLRLLGQRAGYYGLEFGLALFAITNVMTFTALIWVSALRLTHLDNDRARAALAATRLAAIVESTDDAIISKGLDGIIKSWNKGAERLFGYRAQDAVGQHVSILIPPDREIEEAQIIARIASGKSVAHFDTQRLNRAGALIDISVTVSPVRDEAGKIVAASKVARDIGERRLIEARLAAAFKETADLNASLEQRVKSRTEELVAANAALQQAAMQLEWQRAELERSNRDLEQFAYVASHDLQEPLRAVAGCGQILRRRYEGRLDAHADELIVHIVEGAERMQALILDLLAYARVGRGGQQPSLVDSAVAFRQALASLQSVILENAASVTVDALPTVRADAGQLAQLFQNLVGNALKYRGASPPEVHVEAKHSGLEWEFAVRDNGIGIEDQYFERIFVLFQRLHTRNEYAGTGIGLALCRKIVERHGGRIWLESAVGRGSIFRFTIPSGESS